MFGIETKKENVKFFTAIGTNGTATRAHVWTKKRGVKFYTFICVGAGGAGGNGFSGVAGSARGGGGAGGSGAISRLRIHASFLPDTLYIYPGRGGRQGAVTTGELSLISLTNRTTATNLTANYLLRSGAANAGAGNNGTAGAGGTGGVAGTIDTNSGCPYAAWGEYISIAGIIGSAGGAQTGAIGVGVTAQPLPLIAATGGAGCGVSTTEYEGGLINVSSGFIVPNLLGGLAGGGAGNKGFYLEQPLRLSGGTGGGSRNAAAGGNGGDGNFGCGGGGGGAGTTGGTGGKGGDGFIIIIEEY